MLDETVIPIETSIDVINQMFRMGGHHLFAWNYQALSASLATTGYQNITRWQSCQASCNEICLDDLVHAFETLYVEAVKPSLG